MHTIRRLKYKRTNHIGHFLLTCLTGGAWILVWIIIAQCDKAHNDRVAMQETMLSYRQH